MFLYVFCQWVVGRFFLSLGFNPLVVYFYWLTSAAMVFWLNLSFRLGLKRPFRLFPVFFGQFFFFRCYFWPNRVGIFASADVFESRRMSILS